MNIIKETLGNFIGEYESFIDETPRLLEELISLNKGIVETPHIISAISYFINPADVLDMKIYGPYGYIPHIYVAIKAIEMDYGEKDDFLLSKCLELLSKEEIEKIKEHLGW